MLRRSHTATIEKNETYTTDFETVPYETGWASEALWFVRVTDMTEGTVFRAHPQISPDGLFWCDRGDEPITITQTGLYALALRDFGGWLRLRCELEGADPKVKLMIHLALKE